MSGKPTMPSDVDLRHDLHGASLAPPGMESALDEERAASMADEGGASGMLAESQDPTAIVARPRPRWALWAGLCVAAALLGLALWRRAR